MEHSASTEGQWLFQLLTLFGLTPQQWRDLDLRDATFLAGAFNEQNRREREAMKKAEAQRRVGGR